MSSTPKFFIVDGTALAYRSYYAFKNNPLINSKGENTSAPFAFTRLLIKIIDEEKPDYLAIAFDLSGPTFRHESYDAYKANRKPMPDDLAEQLPRIRQIVETYGIPIVEQQGYEADDVIGTLVKKAEQNGINTYMVTGDKDLMQLVSPHVWMYNLKKVGEEPEIIDSERVLNKMGVPPERIIDYLSLMGDSVDNIPGAKGVGEKSARELLQEYGSLEKIIENCENIPNKRVREGIKSSIDLIWLSKQLATLETNVPLKIDLEGLRYHEANPEALLKLFTELEFKSLIDNLNTRAMKFSTQYHVYDSLDKVDELCQNLLDNGQFTLDLETTNIDPLQAEIVGLSFSFRISEAFYIPVKSTRHQTQEIEFTEENEYNSLEVQDVLKRFKPLLANADIKKSGQNIKYDLLVLSNYGIVVDGVDFDTMVASYVLDPEKRQHNLDSLALEYFNYKKIPTTDLIGKGKNQISMSQVPIEKVAEYAAEDADMTWRLKELFEKKLKETGLEKLFHEVEMPLVTVLMQIEQNGVAIDVPFLKQMEKQFDQEMSRLIKKIEEIAGSSINLNSPKQLGDLLFNKLKLPTARKTKTGYSTDVTVLEGLAKKYELPRVILDYRQLSKLQSTYVAALPKLINPRTKRIHTSYNQTVATTGRLSSSDPNLQNIPIRTEIGREIRRAFIPGDKNHILLDADYSQIELRIMAHLSGDATLRDSFIHGEDIHRRTAALILNLPPEAVDDEQRRQAKAINFGIIYGMGAFGLASRLDISQQEAQLFIDAYFSKYPGVKNFMEEVVKKAQKDGYVSTMLGRQRRLPDILSNNRRRREFAERTAINTPIQGTAADMIKLAMINIHNRIQREKLNLKMIMQVHDELVFEVLRDELEYAKTVVREEMEGALKLDVPVKADVGAGENWLEAH